MNIIDQAAEGQKADRADAERYGKLRAWLQKDQGWQTKDHAKLYFPTNDQFDAAVDALPQLEEKA